MSRTPSTILTAVLLALLLSACVAPGGGGPRPAPATMADALFEAGEYADAARAYLHLADQQRSDADALRLRAAEAWREDGDAAAAQAALDTVRSDRLGGGDRSRLALLRAALALDAGRPEAALSALDRLGTPAAVPQQRRALELRARALEAARQPFAAARVRATLDGLLPTGERADNARQIAALLRTLDDATLQREATALAANDPLQPFAGRALTRRGLRAPGEGGPSDIMAGDTAPPRRIALLLPLSGSIAAAARSVRDGFFTAYYAGSGPRSEITLIDAGDTPDTALAAYREAAQAGVDLVVGPLARESVAALFVQGAMPVPVLALNRGGAVPPPAGSLSFALTPDEDGIAAAERALDRGLGRVVLIGIDDETSQRTLAAARDRIAQRGGSVVAEIQLPDDSINYAPVLKRGFAGLLHPPADPKAIATVPPDFDAIIVSVRRAQARMLVPQLKVVGAYHGLLLGSSQLHQGDADPRMDRELDGLEFTTLPWLIDQYSDGPARASVEAALDSARGPAARLFAFGMDAYRLSAHLAALAHDPNALLQGATGELSLDGYGHVARTPAWAVFRRGQPHPVEGIEAGDVHPR